MNGPRRMPPAAPMPAEHRKVIVASSLGALFEWYDFYLYGALAADPRAAVLRRARQRGRRWCSRCSAFAAGFVVRPIGALAVRPARRPDRAQVHLPGHAAADGRGDVRRRRAAGLRDASASPHRSRWSCCGCCRGWRSAASTAASRPTSPSTRRTGKRGAYTGWIQTTATLGLLLALLVIVGVRSRARRGGVRRLGLAHPVPAVDRCCWSIGVWIRLSLKESPPFRRIKQAGRCVARAADRGVRRAGSNLKLVFIALFGLVAGQAVVWYTGQFQALFFLTLHLKVDDDHREPADAPPRWRSARRCSSCSARCRIASAASRSSWRAACWRRSATSRCSRR